MRRVVALCVGIASVSGAASCAQPDVGIRLRFPSEQTFLAAAVATVDVYDGGRTGAQSPDAICRALSVTSSLPPSGVQAIASSGKQDVCSFRAGGVTLRDVDVGRRVFFVEVQDFSGAAILRGCQIADVFGDGTASTGEEADALGVVELVDVQLATLPAFADVGAPACATVDDKCGTERVACF